MPKAFFCCYPLSPHTTLSIYKNIVLQDVNAHGPLTGNNSDVDVGEVTLADMSPDDIRAELKRLYLQLELFKSRTIIKDNPHISKRRGGRKAQHRRFSLQVTLLYLSIYRWIN